LILLFLAFALSATFVESADAQQNKAPAAKRAQRSKAAQRARQRARRAQPTPAAPAAPAKAGTDAAGAAEAPDIAANEPAAAPARPAAQELPEREPPGAAGPLPTNMEKIAQATDIAFRPKPPGHLVKFNLQDADLAELVNHISGLTGRRFIYGAKVRQIKATVVSPQPVTLAEAYQAFLSILEVNGMTVVPQGRFLKIIDSAGISNAATPVYSRGAPVPEEERYVTRLYRLEYVTAEEASQLLAKFKSKEGDVTIYGPGQLLIITDTGAQVRRMIRILEEVDIGGSGQRMWIEPVYYGAAADMAKRLNELFELGTPGSSSGLSKVIADDQTNSLIVVGTEDSYLKLIELLKKLDAKPSETGRIHVLPLQHAVAEELAQTLNQMLSGARQGAAARGQGAAQPGGGTAGGLFEGEIQVTADKSTNSLVITSSGHDYAQLRLVIAELDQPRRQVFIEAVIMDVSVSDSVSLGVSSHGGTNADLGGPGDSLILGGFEAGRSVAFPIDQNSLQGFAAGVRGPDLPGTQNLFGTGVSIPAFGVVLNALASSGKSNVLATPHIIATDNVQAEINIGENIPLQTNVGGGLGNLAALGAAAGAQQGGGANLAALGALGGLGFSAPRQDVGNRIRVTPHINESDQVRLEIEQESSAPGAASGTLGAVSITRRTANTTVVVEDQQTVVIGGLTRDEYVTSREKVPILGDLPVLGFLFRRSTVEKRKANLLLILTPYVIREQADLRRIFERKMQERQEFLDRYFVFQTEDWTPPKDYTRTNGLLEDIRQANFEIEEQVRLEEESQRGEAFVHEAGEAIELPESIKSAPAATQPAPAPRPRQQPTNRQRRRPRSEVEPPVRVDPIARSVNVERVE
jgi:general secretion pathway protein D